MSRGDKQSQKENDEAIVPGTGDNADKTGTIRTHPSTGDIEHKVSTNGSPAERLLSNQNPDKKQDDQSREKYLAPMESQALLSMAMEISRMGAWEEDLATKTVYWSPELEEIFGLELGSFSGKRSDFSDLVHEDDRDRILAEIEDAVREHRAYSIEFRFYHTDGSIRWMEGRGEAVFSEKGEPVRLYGVGIDITERKQVEEVTAKIAAIVESSDDAIISKDLNGIITSWNAGAERLFGYTAKEAIGKSITILIPPDRLDEEPRILERLRCGESIDHFETVRVRKDGSTIDISLTISPIKDGHGRVVGASKIARDITESKRAEQALIESERRFAEFMQNLPGLAWIKDKEGRYVFVNDTAEETFGLEKAELYGKTDDEIFPPDTAAHFKKNDRKALEKGAGIQTVEELKHQDGVLHYSIVNKFPIAGPDGNPELVGGVAIDITERKRTEKELRESEKRFRHVFSNNMVPMGIWTKEGGMVDANDALLDLIGYTRDELETGKINWVELTPPEYHERDLQAVAEVEANGFCEPYEKIYLHKNGREIPIVIGGGNFDEAAGGGIFFAVDISDRKRAEANLRDSEARFRMLADNIAQLAWTCDTLGNVTWYNKRWLDYTGMTFEDMKGWDWSKVQHPDHLERVVARVKQSAETGEPWEDTFPLRRQDGQYRWFLSRATPIRDKDGSILCWFGTNTDVTESLEAEEALRENRERLALELAAAQKLHEASTRLIREDGADALYEQILDTAMAIMRSEYASIQMFHPEKGENGELELLGFRGFSPEAAKFWKWLTPNSETTCGIALKTGQRLVVPDVQACDLMTDRGDLEMYAQTGIRAVQSTPLISRTGKLLGMISTHWQEVHEPSEQDLRLFDILARQATDLIERNSAEELLRLAKEFDDAVMGNMGEGLYTVDADGLVTSMNPAAEKLFGWTFEEMRGRKMHDITHYKYSDGTPFPAEECAGFQVLKKGETLVNHEDRFIRKDGTFFDVLYSSSPIRQDGEITGLVVVFTDVTEAKKAEDALRESKERFAKAFNSSPLVFTITSLVDGRLVEVNDTFVEVTGYSREEAIGKTTLELDLWSSSFDRDAELQQLVDAGKVRTLEYSFRTRSGKEIIGLISAERIEIGGEPFALSVIQDISEHKREEMNRHFLFQITEIIRQTEDPQDLLYTVATLTGMHFGASRCLFNEIDLNANRETVHRDYFDGVESVAGVHRLTDYSPITSAEMSDGKTVVNFDSKADERTADDYHRTYEPSRERAYVAVPLMRNGQWVASLWVSDSKPRAWTAQEVGLLETIAERTWLAVEKRRSENALQESEEQYRTLFDLVPVAVYTCNADGVITAYNQNAITLWGREPEPGERFCGSYKIYYPDGRPMPHDTCPMARTLKGETLLDGEDEILVERPDMARKVVIAIPKLLRDDHGNIAGAINCLYDVTELKIAQRALIRSERRAAKDYQALLQNIVPLGQKLGTARDLTTIYRAVHNFICSSMSCSAFFVSFYSPQTKLRTAAYAWGEGEEIDISLLPPMPISPDGGSNSQAILDKRSVVTNRYWDTMKNRPHVVLMENGIDPMSSLVVPMMVKNSVIGTLEVQAHDDRAFTTEHIVAMEMVANLAAVAIENVRLLEAHDKARQEAEAANRTKDEFLSVLSHELRTPLNSMMGWIRMMRLGSLDADHTAKAIEVIDRNTRVQSSLIEDLLDVSRIISGKMRVEKELTDLTTAVKSAATAIRPIAEAKNISFDVDTGEQSLFTDGDPVRLQQIVTNLLQNAIKFTPEHGSISVKVERSGANAIIEVQDSGIGIEQDLLPNIFERFRQGDASTKRGFAGLGLGLTIVRTIVELHGGQITATSDGKDRGTLFTVRLPLSEVLYAEKPVSDGYEYGLPPDHSLEGVKILLVDDDADSVRPLALFLQDKKADVVTAESAAAALQEFANGQFDILITDIGMPGVDGFELLREIRSSMNGGSNIPAIAVTAYASAEDRAKAFETGFQHHLAKPIDYEELLNAVKSLRVSKGAGV